MKSTLLSNIFVVLYIAATLWLRIILESQLSGHFLISLGLGIFALIFLWALIRSGIIRPTLLGLDRFGPARK